MARARGAKSGEDMLVKSAEFVGWALGGLEREIVQTRERLAALNAHALNLRTRLGKGKPAAAASTGAEPTTTAASRKQRRRQMSADARERISSAMKKRWAERKKSGG